jgi:methylenetetrahydrofolate reductase (NADPH)
LERKRQAGAQFVQTQMVMDAAVLERFCRELAAPMGLPVLAGVFLLKSARNAQFINRMVPGACIPDALIERLANAKNPAAEGVAIAAEQVRRYLGIAQGVHLMAVKAEERIPEILRQAGVSSQAVRSKQS